MTASTPSPPAVSPKPLTLAPAPAPTPGGGPWGPLCLPEIAAGVEGTNPSSLGPMGWAAPRGGPTSPALAPSATQSCPDGARDFRAVQCSAFDSQEFQGRRYRWLPYYGGECAGGLSTGGPAAPPHVFPCWSPSSWDLFYTSTFFYVFYYHTSDTSSSTF